MQHSGIGGGGFMLVRDAKGNYESIGECSEIVGQVKKAKLIVY